MKNPIPNASLVITYYQHGNKTRQIHSKGGSIFLVNGAGYRGVMRYPVIIEATEAAAKRILAVPEWK